MTSKAKNENEKANDLLVNAARSTSYNIVLQILLRIVTFLTNAFIVHYASKEVLGIVNVRLMLLYSTTQFLTREAFRRAAFSNKLADSLPFVINLMWITVPVSVILGVVFRSIWLNALSQPDPQKIFGYDTAVNSVVASVVIEMVAEPLYVVTQLSQFVKLRIVAEGLSLMTRCCFMAIAIVNFPKHGVAAFACGQLLSSILYSLIYYLYAFYLQSLGRFPVHSFRNLFPSKYNGKWYNAEMLTLTKSFFKQTFVKQILTEGERYIMTVFNILSFSEQGVYDIVNNLSSLAARFIFQPIEENSYLYFAQSLGRGKPNQESDEISRILKNIIKIMIILSSIVLAFGTCYASEALYLYGGKSLASGVGPKLLSWHCFYIMFIAINGPTECFVFATMSSQAIENYNKIMVALSVVFLIAAYYLTIAFGSVGFILANSLNMAFRVIHSLLYISKYFTKSKPLTGLLLNKWLILILITCNLVLRYIGNYLNYSRGIIYLLLHISIGGFCLMLVIGVIYLFEKQLVGFINSFFARAKIE